LEQEEGAGVPRLGGRFLDRRRGKSWRYGNQGGPEKATLPEQDLGQTGRGLSQRVCTVFNGGSKGHVKEMKVGRAAKRDYWVGERRMQAWKTGKTGGAFRAGYVSEEDGCSTVFKLQRRRGIEKKKLVRWGYGPGGLRLRGQFLSTVNVKLGDSDSGSTKGGAAQPYTGEGGAARDKTGVLRQKKVGGREKEKKPLEKGGLAGTEKDS